MSFYATPHGIPGYSKREHADTGRGLRYCGEIVMRFGDEWVTLRCPDARQMLRVPRPVGTIDNSAISILDGLGRSWRQYAAHRVGGWHITRRSNER